MVCFARRMGSGISGRGLCLWSRLSDMSVQPRCMRVTIERWASDRRWKRDGVGVEGGCSESGRLRKGTGWS